MGDRLLASLSAQVHLRTLVLKYGPYTDLRPLQSSTQLTELELGGASALIDLSPLTQLPLTHLSVENGRRVRDFSPLAGIPTLRYLYVGTGITGSRSDADSLDFVRRLPELRVFIWSPRVGVKDYAPLRALTNAQYISVQGEREQTPSLVDLEWELPGMQAAKRELAEHVVPIYNGDQLVAEMKTDITGRKVILPIDPLA